MNTKRAPARKVALPMPDIGGLPYYIQVSLPTLSGLLPLARVSNTATDYFLKKYLWQNHSGWFDLEDYYLDILEYEREYGIKSVDMYKKWREDRLPFQGGDINDWLLKYVQIKERLVEA